MKMKIAINILFSIFFAVAIWVHIKNVMNGDDKPIWWHVLYFITYGVCWAMIFSKHKSSLLIYGLMAVFPFFTHLYYGFQHFAALDKMFWTCVLVCGFLIWGFKTIKINTSL